ncbi:hypothetical protein GGD38_000277 [Chitinophagaceae bacterium OAS944]|nr:hypothetical protein [Chitinophagaceae bacterium OAS944]
MGFFSGYFLVLTTQKYVRKTPCVNSFGELGKCIAEWRKLPGEVNRQSAIGNRQSAIGNRQSAIGLNFGGARS